MGSPSGRSRSQTSSQSGYGRVMEEGPAIGIDLGTTNSCVAVWKDGHVEIIPNDQGQRTTPSCVAFTNAGVLVGNAAKNQAVSNATNTVFQAKRFIGRNFDDPLVQENLSLLPFKVVSGAGGEAMVMVTDKGETKTFSPQHISSMILKYMKKTAEEYLDCKVSNAVVTVPANFSQAQKLATRDAAESAGLKVLRLVTEPSAAAIAYAYGTSSTEGSTNGYGGHVLNKSSNGKERETAPTGLSNGKAVMVVDWGGGTFDVSIMMVKNDDEFVVTAVSGDTHLGGEDMDDRLSVYFAHVFQAEHGKDVRGNVRAMRRLRGHCGELRHALSFLVCASTNIDFLMDGIDFVMEMKRSRFEDLNADLFNRCMRLVEKALKDAKLERNEISKIILAGGTTRIPKIQTLLKEFFDGRELCKSIHPDEAIATGAAIRAAMMTGAIGIEMKDLAIIEAIPVSIGFEGPTGEFHRLIEANATYPTKVIEQCRTGYHGATECVVRVREGERKKASENRYLGDVRIKGLHPGPPGSLTERVFVDLVLEIDGDGILTVTLVDKVTNRSDSESFRRNWGRFSAEEAEKMAEVANHYLEEDEAHLEKKRAMVDLNVYIKKARRHLCVAEITENERKIAVGQVDGAKAWIRSEEPFSTEEYNERKRKLEEICEPLIQRVVAQRNSTTINDEISTVVRNHDLHNQQ